MAKEARIFTTLLKIVTDLGLVDTLKEAEAVTIFAPPDEAFEKLPDGTIDSLTTEEAREIVLRHVVNSKVLAADVDLERLVKTLGGEEIQLFNTDVGGVQIVYEGNTITVDKADVMASNGVIHIIDKVILPEPEKLGDVVEVAIEAGIFNTLLKIVTDVGLVDTLKEAEAVTVFAPPDEAFAKLPAGTIESLTPEQAKEIVLRHVVDSKVLAADVARPVKLKTLGGEVIKLINRKGQILIEYEGNVITVDKADVMARNGVIHIINKVILPAAIDESKLDAISELLYCSNF